MKKIVTGIVALAMASSMFAANFAARVKMDTNLAQGDKNGTSLLKVKKADQKDADALVISTSGDKAGANFQFWYNWAGNDADLKVRSTNLWFKPVDMVKVTVGDVSVGTYKEMINWWKDPVGGSLAAWNGWGAKYKSFATVEGAGVSVDVTPISGLLLTAGFTAGADTSSIIFNKEVKDATGKITQEASKAISAYGFGAKYDNIAGLPVSAAITWHDEGISSTNSHWTTKDGSKSGIESVNVMGDKWLSVGADYGNNWAAGFYGFLNARMRFESLVKDGKTTISMAGVTFDNYCKYSVGAFTVLSRFPVTLRTPDKKDAKDDKAKKAITAADPSYLCWEIKATYALNGFTPYFDIGNDLDNAGAWVLFSDKDTDNKAFADSFNMEIKPGVTVNVGSCAIDAAVQMNLKNEKNPKYVKDGKEKRNNMNFSWEVPVVLSVAF